MNTQQIDPYLFFTTNGHGGCNCAQEVAGPPLYGDWFFIYECHVIGFKHVYTVLVSCSWYYHSKGTTRFKLATILRSLNSHFQSIISCSLLGASLVGNCSPFGKRTNHSAHGHKRRVCTHKVPRSSIEFLRTRKKWEASKNPPKRKKTTWCSTST